jgi:membrane protein implicated in regulation of membrane protease activity
MWKIEGPELAVGEKVRVAAVDGVVLKVESDQAAAPVSEET